MAGRKTYITVNDVLHRTGVSSTIQRRKTHNARVRGTFKSWESTQQRFAPSNARLNCLPLAGKMYLQTAFQKKDLSLCISVEQNKKVQETNMAEQTITQTVPKEPLNVPQQLEPLNLPAISEALREVYKVGSIPLVLIFLAAVALCALLVQGIVQTLPAFTFLIGFLIALGVVVFLFLNWMMYRQWRTEVNTLVENRRLEMDLYLKLWTSNREIQDKFLLSLLKYTGELAGKSDSTPEGRKKEIEFLSDSLGKLVREFVDVRNQLQLPQLTPLLPKQREAPASTQVNSPSSS
jgi:hypothetical protein